MEAGRNVIPENNTATVAITVTVTKDGRYRWVCPKCGTITEQKYLGSLSFIVGTWFVCLGCRQYVCVEEVIKDG